MAQPMAARLVLHVPLDFQYNAPREYKHITVKPLAAAMGAEIQGIEKVRDITDDAFSEIEDALFRHKMVYFRGQEDMTHEEHAAFSRRFGEFAVDAYTKGMPGHPNVQPLLKEAETRVKILFGSGWHSDSPFLDHPPAITTLRAVEVPPYGGDTMWANGVLAYQTLSDTMKQVIEPLQVLMSGVDVVRELQKGGGMKLGDSEVSLDVQRMIDGKYHPMVRKHPRTGEKSLFVDCTYAKHIQGMSAPEAEPILKFLQQHVTQPAFTCRLRWEPGTLALWDNRICLHQAFNDYNGHRREMYRTTLVGEVAEPEIPAPSLPAIN